MFGKDRLQGCFQIQICIKNDIHLLKRRSLYGNRLTKMPCKQRLGKGCAALGPMKNWHGSEYALHSQNPPKRLADL
ncbi:hypothetical protein D1872_221540 [compost metagenome]